MDWVRVGRELASGWYGWVEEQQAGQPIEESALGQAVEAVLLALPGWAVVQAGLPRRDGTPQEALLVAALAYMAARREQEQADLG